MKKIIAVLLATILLSAIASLPVLAVNEGVSYGDVPKSADAITIDAVKDAVYDKGLKLHLSRTHYEGEPATATNGDAYVLYQDGFILVFGEIFDATLVPTSEDIQGPQPWMVDSLEVFLDPGNDGDLALQYRIDYMGAPSFQLGDDNSYALSYDERVAAKKFEYAAAKTDKGYNVEFKIPCDAAKAGEKIGFQLQINDMADETTRTCVFPSSSLTAGSWDVSMYDYIVLSASEVTAVVATEAVSEAANSTPPAADVPAAPVTPAPTGDVSIILAIVSLAGSAAAIVRTRKGK